MNVLVTHFASGAAFFTGSGCVLLAVTLAARSQTTLGRRATGLGIFGLLAIAASATPLPNWFYCVVLSVSLAWAIVERTERRPRCRRMLRITTIAIWLTAVASEAPYWTVPALEPAARPVLTIFGDSVTAGISGHETETWPQILARTRRLKIVDHSFMGATVATARRKAESVSIDEGLVLLEIGGNDLLGSTPVDDFEAGLDRLLTRASGPGRQVILLELPLPPFYNAYGRVQRRLAKKHGAALIPKRIFMDVLSGDDATLDSIHLTQRGHERMADAVWQVIGDAIQDASIAVK